MKREKQNMQISNSTYSKKLTSKIAILLVMLFAIIGIANSIYAKYILTINVSDIEITSASFDELDVTLDNDEVEYDYDSECATVEVTVANYNNLYDVTYDVLYSRI